MKTHLNRFCFALFDILNYGHHICQRLYVAKTTAMESMQKTVIYFAAAHLHSGDFSKLMLHSLISNFSRGKYDQKMTLW